MGWNAHWEGRDRRVEKEYALLISALRHAIAGTAVQLPEDVDWKTFLRLAREHKVEPLIWESLQKDPQLPALVAQHLFGAQQKAIFQDTQMDFLRQQITEKLNAAGVTHVYLKGSRLKYSYPIPALRTMTDMDILVHTRDYEKIDLAMRSLEGVFHSGDGNHRNYYFAAGQAVEFHPNLIHPASRVAAGINPGWQYVEFPNEPGEQQLTPEGFYLHVLCHMADHFVQAGIGVRFVLDVWVCRHLVQDAPDRAFVESELQRMHLLEFARKVEALAESWFGDEPMTAELEELGEYILTSGSHGKLDRALLNAVCLSPGGTGFSALLKKAFYPRKELEDRYPWSKGRPWLLPAAWCARAFRAVTVHGNEIRTWTKGTMGHSQEDIVQQKEKLERFGVKNRKDS